MHRSVFFSLRQFLVAAAASLAAIAAMAQVEINVAPPLDGLLKRYLKAPGPDVRSVALDAFVRDARKTAAELLATEGYFSPDIDVKSAPGKLSVTVVPGSRTMVSDVSIEIRGDISVERVESLSSAWLLKKGMPFRNTDWNEAKQSLLRRLMELDFAGARLVDSGAEIHPESADALLHVIYETGPRYVFGSLNITGLGRYSPNLVRRYSTIEPGSRYDQNKLLTLQSALQATPYFSSVSVEVAHIEDTAGDRIIKVPVNVHVRERPPHRISLGAGVSSNTGAQTEIIYQGFDFLQRAWQLDTGLRLEQLRQSLYADIHLPAVENQRDSFGALTDREDIEGLRRRRIALGTVRILVRGSVETRYALNWQREIRDPDDAPESANTALTLDGTWTLRRVDDALDPHRGYVAQMQAGGGSKALLSDQNFLRLHGRYQHFFPVATRDVFTVRAELGTTFAQSRGGVPQDFLFRTGGAQSVRGYDYQSLGVKEGNATVGGRYLTVTSAEYTHWFNPRWGGAIFLDAGDAGDDRDSLKLAVGYGAGVRWKSPAGPFAVDLAYGERDQRLRLHFSLAIAF